MKKIWLYLAVIAILILVSSCILIKIYKTPDNSVSNTQIANPASVYCYENNGTLEIRSDVQGNQYGICILANGTECDEWKYFRGGC